MSVISESYSYEERVLETGGQFSVGMPITLETMSLWLISASCLSEDTTEIMRGTFIL